MIEIDLGRGRRIRVDAQVDADALARRAQFGQSSERGQQLIEQLELAIEDLEETQAIAEAKVQIAAPEAA